MASEDFPKTLVEFDERFGIEEACQACLAGLRRPEGCRAQRVATTAAGQTGAITSSAPTAAGRPP